MNPILIDMQAAGDLPERYQKALDAESQAVANAQAAGKAGNKELVRAAMEAMFAAHEQSMELRNEMMKYQIKPEAR